MVESVNLTPFCAESYVGRDIEDRAYDIVVTRVGYEIVPIPGQPFCEARVMDRNPVPLVMADRFLGVPGKSSTLAESDLAPYKPRCDVVVQGMSHAPGKGRLLERKWEAALKLGYLESAKKPPKPVHPSKRQLCYETLTSAQINRWLKECDAYDKACRELEGKWRWSRVLLEKRLKVLGPRVFRDRLVVWSASRSEAVASVPLHWELAYGGGEEVTNEKGETIFAKCWFANPAGCGWKPEGWTSARAKAKLALLTELPAPQLMYPDDTINGLDIQTLPAQQTAKQMAEYVRKHGRYRPGNFGWVGRSWSPRSALAGTYDEHWKTEVWPKLPEDFDFRYWNGAPEDQQIEYPEPGFALELKQLLNPERVKADAVTVKLPAHRAFVLMFAGEGAFIPLPMRIDTVVIDTEAARVDLVWRVAVPRTLGATRLELRFETNPEAPLVKYKEEEK